MERPRVPKFGSWDKEEDVPYTAYFDKARKGRGGKIINPNDPEENPDLFADASDHSTGSKGASDEPSAHSHHHHRHGSNSSRPSRPSGGSRRSSIDRSPLHPHYHGKVTGVGSAGFSPARDVKSPHHSSHGGHTPGRSRMKQSPRGDHGTPDIAGTAIPKFGDWNENVPESAESYTDIFDRAKKDKQSGSSTPSAAKSEPPSYKMAKQTANDQPKGCCFSWFRK